MGSQGHNLWPFVLQYICQQETSAELLSCSSNHILPHLYSRNFPRLLKKKKNPFSLPPSRHLIEPTLAQFKNWNGDFYSEVEPILTSWAQSLSLSAPPASPHPTPLPLCLVKFAAARLPSSGRFRSPWVHRVLLLVAFCLQDYRNND